VPSDVNMAKLAVAKTNQFDVSSLAAKSGLG
jgi:hypothetical protein